MNIEKVVVGVLEENCYVLKNDLDKTCLVVDPGDEFIKIKKVVGDYRVLGVLVTHSHFDHIGALRNFLTKRSIKIFKRSNLLEKEYSIGDFKFNVIYTPGHSKDSVSFLFNDSNDMFVGDFIFEGDVGRCDLPGGSYDELIDSLKKLKAYPTDIKLHPGHGNSTTIGNECKNNFHMINI
jgi:putative metallo-beta-lactamase family protein